MDLDRKVRDGKFLGRPFSYWIDLDRRIQEHGLDGLLDSFYRDLAQLRLERDEQFRRAERLLRAGMHHADRALDTAAGKPASKG